MSEKSEATVIGALPHSRPQRRSDKRAARQQQEETVTEPSVMEPTAAKRSPAAKQSPAAKRSPAAKQSPAAKPGPNATGCSSLPAGAELIGTVVKAAAELAEIGLTVGARALRTAISRLPRP